MKKETNEKAITLIIKIDNTEIKAAWNKPYQATITTEGDYIIDTITVTMVGQAVAVDKTTGVINIDKVTDDIEITVIAKKLEIKYTVIAVNTTSSATTSLGANIQPAGTTLYINLIANLEGIDCIITNKDDNKPVPYAIKKNGKYTFIVTGTYSEKTITEEKEITVNQYESVTELVKYDAGEWTQGEIDELKTQKLYDYNSEHNVNRNFKLLNEIGLNFTFGGFQAGESRNGSVSPMSGAGIPKYDKWQILESKEENGRTYVTKLVHAGSPENFVYSCVYYIGDAYRTEYILSGGTRRIEYSTLSDGKTTINTRNI